MAKKTNKPEKGQASSSNRKMQGPKIVKGKPVPTDKILEHLQAAKREIDTLNGLQQQEKRGKEKLKVRSPAPGLMAIQKPVENEKIGGYTSVREEGRIKETKTGLRPLASQKAAIQKPGETVKDLTALSKRTIRAKEPEKIRPLALFGGLIQKPGELQKFQSTESSTTLEPTVERIESKYIFRNPEAEKVKNLKRLIWIALFLGIFNLILFGVYELKTLVPEFISQDLQSHQVKLTRDVKNIEYKSSIRDIIDTLFKARVLIEINKDYKEAVRELEKVKMGLNLLETSLADQKGVLVKDLLKEMEIVLVEVRKEPDLLQEKLADISKRLNALLAL